MKKGEIESFKARLSAELIRQIMEAGDVLAKTEPGLPEEVPSVLLSTDRIKLFDQSMDTIEMVAGLAYWVADLAEELNYRLDAKKYENDPNGAGMFIRSGPLRLEILVGPRGMRQVKLRKSYKVNWQKKKFYTVSFGGRYGQYSKV